MRKSSLSSRGGLERILKFIPAICTPHFAAYLPRIRLPQPDTPRSFGDKSPTNRDAHLTESNFQTRSGNAVEKCGVSSSPVTIDKEDITANGYIGLEKARELVLTQPGLDEAAFVDKKYKLDDGVYELEFTSISSSHVISDIKKPIKKGSPTTQANPSCALSPPKACKAQPVLMRC